MSAPQDTAKVLARRLWELAGEIGTVAERGDKRLDLVYEALSPVLDECERQGLIEEADGPTLEAVRLQAQVESDMTGRALAVGLRVSDDTGEDEYAYCPPLIVGRPGFVHTVLETVRPRR